MRKTIVSLGAAALLMAAGCAETSPELVEDGEQASTDEAAEDGGGADGSGDGADGDDDSGDDGEDGDAGGDGGDGDAAEGPFAVGDTVAMGDLEHVLHGARWSEGDEFFGPEEGERWIVLDVELTNTGDSSEAISSMIMWTFVDSENRSRDLEITGDEQGSLDGELGAGRSMRGEIAYSLPADDSGPWELVFEPQLLGFGQAIYTISEDDVSEG